MAGIVRINERLAIPADELRFTASGAGGPGGQHVNRVRTRITLWFDVEGSSALDDAQRRRLRERLPTRIDSRGRLRVVCGRHRSQAANRREAVARFVTLVAGALARRRRRRPTGVPEAERRRRAEEKRRRSRLKQQRRPVDDD